MEVHSSRTLGDLYFKTMIEDWDITKELRQPYQTNLTHIQSYLPYQVKLVRTQVNLPHDATMTREIELSPRGDRIAYLIWHTEPDMLPILHYILPRKDQLRTSKSSLWVSRRDGSELHEIGACPMHEQDGRGERYPKLLHWLPDGKHVSFVYHDSLYTVPID
jgi:hypothetical protein